MLQLENIHVALQSSPILRGLSLHIEAGELIGLLGRNGAGKTTTLRTIMGLTQLSNGKIFFENKDISNLPAHQRPRLGLGYMPEDRRLVPLLTVEENILLPTWVIPSLDAHSGLKFVYELMPELAQMKARKAMLLSGGQQKMVALARALMAGTHLLLLDEPFEGVAPALSQRLAEVIAKLREQRRSILIAQSELAHTLALLDREYLIERGAIMDK